jgi:hypothetical protein
MVITLARKLNLKIFIVRRQKGFRKDPGQSRQVSGPLQDALQAKGTLPSTRAVLTTSATSAG